MSEDNPYKLIEDKVKWFKSLINGIQPLKDNMDKSSYMWLTLFIDKWEKAYLESFTDEEYFDWWKNNHEEIMLDEVKNGYIKKYRKDLNKFTIQQFENRELVFQKIENCKQENHIHQVAYSIYEKRLTHICFMCEMIHFNDGENE